MTYRPKRGPRESGGQKNSSTGIAGVWSSKHYSKKHGTEVTIVYAWVPHPDKPRRGISTTFKVGKMGKHKDKFRTYMEAIELAKKWRADKIKELWGIDDEG